MKNSRDNEEQKLREKCWTKIERSLVDDQKPKNTEKEVKTNKAIESL